MEAAAGDQVEDTVRDTFPAGYRVRYSGSLASVSAGHWAIAMLSFYGVLTAVANYPVRPQEIMWSLVVALYRRAVILGESGREGPAIDEATRVGIRAACTLGRKRGIVAISAGNYGGKLGPFLYHLKDLLP